MHLIVLMDDIDTVYPYLILSQVLDADFKQDGHALTYCDVFANPYDSTAIISPSQVPSLHFHPGFSFVLLRLLGTSLQ